MLIPFLLLAIALSVYLAESLQKIENSIQESFNKLFSFFINPIFIISLTLIFLTGLVFLTISNYRSHIEYRKKLTVKTKEIKKLHRAKPTKIYPKTSEEEAEFEDEDSGEDDSEKEPYETTPVGTYRRSVNIRVDEDKRYFHMKNTSVDEVKYLLNMDYQIKKYKNLLTGRMENFLLQPRFNESFTHLFLTKNISEFLEKNGIETELYTTKKPDIVFQINKKRYAIEIETGSIFSKIERMKEKLEVLKNYDEWFFVVTDRNKVKKYKKYGDAVDKRYIKSRLDNLVKMAKKAQK